MRFKIPAVIIGITAFIFCTSLLPVAETTESLTGEFMLSRVVTCSGLDADSGLPVDARSSFSFTEDDYIQFFVSWHETASPGDYSLKWFSPEGYMLKHHQLEDYGGTNFKSYIGLREKTEAQTFIPEDPGDYYLYFYVNDELRVLTIVTIRD